MSYTPANADKDLWALLGPIIAGFLVGLFFAIRRVRRTRKLEARERADSADPARGES